MKVIQLSTFFHPSVGGVERQVEEISTHLASRDIEVTVFTTNASHGSQKNMMRLRDEFRGIPVHRFRYRLGFGYFFRFAPGLVWELCKADFDILHVHNTHDAHLIPAIIIKFFRRKKLIITGHNPYIVGAEKRGERLNFFVRVYEVFFRLFSGMVDKYVALLKSEQEEVIRRFRWKESKVAVVPNGIQDLFYHDDGVAERFYSQWEIKPEKWKLVVGAACRMNYVKGIQNLQKAVEKLPRVLFVFVGGDGGYLDQLKVIYRKANNVIFTEKYVPSDEVKDFYQAIDLFLLPSVYEPFGMTVVESMAQGVPVLATSNGGPQEIMTEEVGHIIDPDDQDAWMKQIKYYVENRLELEEMGQKAKQLSTQYQWGRVIEQLIEVYKSTA